MKATGVVRRIDDLGRIVIPKELRRTMRIKEGESLEIFTDGADNIVLKKYSPVQSMNDFITEYAESLYTSSKKDIIVTDNEHVIAVAGTFKKDLVGKKVSTRLEEKLQRRTTQTFEKGDSLEITESFDIKRPAILKPINVYGDVLGCIIIAGNESITDVEKTLAEFSGHFLGRYLEG
ncbi:MAG: stage V sporulation T C-terminal domain-containing protein [Bacilli bacterium]|jgi:AbrB family transcriptional regulator (stage V sporulation protein T)|nr:AbrB/MazE/SpoVT family DNA-binding domain-containing protein [Acholeplasmataceae bacterium]